MLIGETEVKTPFDRDDPGVVFEPDWRTQVILAWLKYPKTITAEPKLYRDKYTQQHLQLLKSFQQNDDGSKKYVRVNLGPKMRSYQFAYARSEETAIESMRPKLDALLLTNVSYEVIAKDLGGNRLTAEDIRTYEKLYFNVRDEYGNLDTSCFLRTRFAMPIGAVITEATPLTVIWKTVGNMLGYVGLVRTWGWSGQHGELGTEEYLAKAINILAQTLLFQRLMTGRANNFDILGCLSNNLERERLNSEKSVRSQGSTRSDQALMRLFTAKAPHMLDSALIVDKNKSMVGALAAKIAAQRNVGGTKIMDAGHLNGEASIKQYMDEKFKDMGDVK